MENRQMKFPIAAPLFIFLALLAMINLFTGSAITIVLALLSMAAYILLSVGLFMKKRGVLLIIGTAIFLLSTLIGACGTVFQLFSMIEYIPYMSVPNLIMIVLSALFDCSSVLMWLIILFIVLALCEKLGPKMQKFAGKVWFIPVLLLFLAEGGLNLGSAVANILSFSYGTPDLIFEFIGRAIGFSFSSTVKYLTIFLMLMWMRNPYRKEAAPAAQPVPVQSVENAVLAQPVEPVQPIQSVESIEPVQSIENVEPAQSEAPIQQ